MTVARSSDPAPIFTVVADSTLNARNAAPLVSGSGRIIARPTSFEM